MYRGVASRHQHRILSPTGRHPTRRAALHQSRTLSVGLDVHQASIAVAYVAKDPDAAVLSLGTCGTRHCDIDTLRRQRPSKATPLGFVDAAGPGGAWRSRSLPHTDDGGGVVAPSLMPHKAGDRVHTDRRDARQIRRPSLSKWGHSPHIGSSA